LLFFRPSVLLSFFCALTATEQISRAPPISSSIPLPLPSLLRPQVLISMSLFHSCYLSVPWLPRLAGKSLQKHFHAVPIRLLHFIQTSDSIRIRAVIRTVLSSQLGRSQTPMSSWAAHGIRSVSIIPVRHMPSTLRILHVDPIIRHVHRYRAAICTVLKLQTSSPTGTGSGNIDIRVAVSGNLQCRSRHFSISFPIYLTHFITQLIIHYLANK
jgi:hypothetical protein